MTKAQIIALIGNAHTEKQIERKLKSIPHTVDKSENYYNCYIPKRETGAVRVYIAYSGEVKVQQLNAEKFNYSGTPVYFGGKEL